MSLLTRFAPIARRVAPQVRSLSTMGDGLIPSDTDFQTGRRKQELDGTTFNRDPIFVSKGIGTKENPVEVPSHFSERIVGIDDPETAQLVWFNLKKGPLHYLSPVDKYFKLVQVGH